MNINKKIFIFALALSLFYSCARNPVTGKKELMLMSEGQELALGKESDPSIIAQYGVYENAQLQAFITEKGKQMAAISHRPNLNYEFKILDSPVVNAFAVPGGYVYFTRGIMGHFNNEAEFAGVLGHEIGHIAAKHSAQQYSKQMLTQVLFIGGMIVSEDFRKFADVAQQGIGLLFLKFSRDNETESDKLGVDYSTKIGYDAHEMAGFFKTLKKLICLTFVCNFFNSFNISSSNISFLVDKICPVFIKIGPSSSNINLKFFKCFLFLNFFLRSRPTNWCFFSSSQRSFSPTFQSL